MSKLILMLIVVSMTGSQKYFADATLNIAKDIDKYVAGSLLKEERQTNISGGIWNGLVR